MQVVGQVIGAGGLVAERALAGIHDRASSAVSRQSTEDGAVAPCGGNAASGILTVNSQ
jgi:hypothetical protein